MKSETPSSKKAIIIGASSGIGAQIAIDLSARGYTLGLTARRLALMEQELKPKLATPSHFEYMDVVDIEASIQVIRKLVRKMGGIDLIIINAGVSGSSSRMERQAAEELIRINVLGFAGMLHEAYRIFQKQGHGHIVGISSIASLLPHPNGSAYNASKAFVSNYLDSIRLRIKRRNENIVVTDVLPGYVLTPMTRENKRMFWVAGVEKASAQIVDDIEKKRSVSYVSRRWRLIAWLLSLMPRGLLNRIL
ncbi:SDR family NAD(P)-dependent oxidoreductase [Balneolales bacterium ANBcel1]|nr:SDR family NAD(P)-dependent oxidoreductase [Balneolales bacterium ANBcel1]